MDHSKPRILIVDDQNSIRRTMTVIVDNLGCQAVAVEDGYHAIESVKNEKFELVFLDIKMPGINGVQTFREIKKLRPDSLVVMMTGCDVQELLDNAVDEGAMSVLHKPFEPKQIAQMLHVVNELCPERLPSNIGGLNKEIQDRLDAFAEGLPLARLAVRLPDSEMKALRLLAVTGPASEQTPMLASLTSSEGVVFYNDEVQVINDPNLRSLICDSDIALGVKSALVMPIISSAGRSLGSISASCYETNYFEQALVGRFSEFALSLGDQMESASLAEAELLHSRHRIGIPIA